MSENRAKIRVLQLISGIAIGRQAGGAEAHALQVARLLDRRRFTPAVFGMWQQGGAVEERWQQQLAQWDLPLYGMVPWPGNLGAGLQPLRRTLWQAVSAFQPHIISTHSERGDWLNGLLRLLHPLHPLAVRSVHIDRPWQSHPLAGYLLERAVFPHLFAAEVAISETILTQLRRRRRDQTRLHLIYNGVDEAIFSTRGQELPLRAELPGKRPYVGIVGRLTEQKGGADLLHAAAQVIQRRPITLLFVGDGPLRGDLQRLAAQLGIAERVHFLGVRDDVPAILARLDIFALPSYWEGFPTVILEAMSQYVPVIASDVSGSRELVRNGQTGLLIAPGARAQLAQAMHTLLDSPPQAQQMARQAHQFAARFTYQQMARDYEAVYLGLR